MDLKDYARLLRRSWTAIAAFVLLGVLAAAAFSLLARPTYTAQTRLFVAIQSAGSVAELQQGNTFTQARVQSYVETVKTPAVLQPVIDDLGLDMTAAQLAGSVTASADLKTVLLTISTTGSSPAEAATTAQAVGDSLINTVGDLESPTSGGTSPIKLSVVTPAVAPTAPSSPNLKQNLALGLLGGLAGGVVFAIARGTLDTKVRGESDVTRIADTPVLGRISFDPETEKKPLFTQAGHQSPRAESFRHIRTNLQFATVNSTSKTLLITSSLPGEGKSTTATNLAIAMAQAGQRVVLVDADLRRPSVAEYLGLESSAGLTTALVGAADVADLLQPWGENDLQVLTSGQIPPNPSELLGSDAMSRLLSELAGTFDAVIIDAPPLIPVTDASVLAQKVGGVVLVVGALKAKTQDVEKSLSSLKLVGANLVGTVINLLPPKGPDANTYGYYSYQSTPDSRGAAALASTGGSHAGEARLTRTTARDVDASASDR